MQGDICNIITHAKFYVNRFRGFAVLTAPILPFSIGSAGHPYNTTVLHCGISRGMRVTEVSNSKSNGQEHSSSLLLAPIW